jgi:hypothetical protein
MSLIDYSIKVKRRREGEEDESTILYASTAIQAILLLPKQFQ